jgi:hypothetical protein
MLILLFFCDIYKGNFLKWIIFCIFVIITNYNLIIEICVLWLVKKRLHLRQLL